MATHERFEKKVDEEAIENEGKRDKVEDALGQATTSSKTEGEAEGYERKAKHSVVEDSPSLEASPEDYLKHDKVEDAQGTADETGGEAEGDEKKSEPQPKLDDSIAENLKVEKELIPESQTISTVTEPAPDDAANSQPEEPPPTESTETDKEKQPKTANISEGSVETIQELSDTAEANPLTESEVEVVKETEHLETSFQKLDKPEHAVIEVQEKSEEPEKESQDKSQVEVSDPSAETNEKPNDVKEKPEPIVSKVHENSEETEKESQEKTREAEQPNTIAVSDSSAETNEKLSDATEKTEPIVTDVHEKSEETEKESQEKLHEIPDPSAETSGKLGDAIEEKTRDTKFDESKATEKAEHVITEKVAANDDKKQQGAHGPAIEAAAVDNEKQGQPETKLEVTETLASKLEEKEEEKPTKENDATKTPEDLPKETPVKPTQKQSNNIISKVKRSLLKAKKAIIGKSPTTSETISSQAKGDIKVK